MGQKLLRNLTQGIFVQQSGISNVKKALIDNGEYVVLVTPHKSCLDFFVILYTLV